MKQRTRPVIRGVFIIAAVFSVFASTELAEGWSLAWFNVGAVVFSLLVLLLPFLVGLIVQLLHRTPHRLVPFVMALVSAIGCFLIQVKRPENTSAHWSYVPFTFLLALAFACIGLRFGLDVRYERKKRTEDASTGKRCIVGAVILVTCLLCGSPVVHTGRLVFSRSPGVGAAPICGRLVKTAFVILMKKQLSGPAQEAGPWINVDGDSNRSLVVLESYMGGEPFSEKYMYVPGLRLDDPSDLIMLYMKDRTRYRWEGDRTSVFRKPGWSITSPTFQPPEGGTEWECNEWVDTAQFRARLKRTLAFLKDNDRPHWESVVKEHEAFLASVASE